MWVLSYIKGCLENQSSQFNRLKPSQGTYSWVSEVGGAAGKLYYKLEGTLKVIKTLISCTSISETYVLALNMLMKMLLFLCWVYN